MTDRTKDTLKWLINKELQEEYNYQFDNIFWGQGYDDSLIRDLIEAERELFFNRAKPFDKIIWAELIKEDIAQYLDGLKRAEELYKKQEEKYMEEK